MTLNIVFFDKISMISPCSFGTINETNEVIIMIIKVNKYKFTRLLSIAYFFIKLR